MFAIIFKHRWSKTEIAGTTYKSFLNKGWICTVVLKKWIIFKIMVSREILHIKYLRNISKGKNVFLSILVFLPFDGLIFLPWIY